MDDLRRDLEDIRLNITETLTLDVLVSKMRFLDVYYPHASRDFERFKQFFVVNIQPPVNNVKEHWQDAARLFVEEMRIAWPDVFGPVGQQSQGYENDHGHDEYEDDCNEGGDSTTVEKREDGGEVMVLNVAPPEADGWEVVEKDELVEWEVEEFVQEKKRRSS